MAEAYSGLRRRRKRTHPSKCPCCISDDVEPENEGTAGNEELHVANSKKDVRHKQNKRRKIVKKKDIDFISDSEVSDHAAIAEKEKNPNLKKTKLRSSRNSSPTNDEETSKDTKNSGKDTSKSWNKTENNNGKKGSMTVSGKKDLKVNGKNSISLQKSSLEDISDEDISLSSLKASRSRKKGSTSTDSETSGKKKKSKENTGTKDSNKKKSVYIRNKKKKIQENNDLESNALENENTRTKNGNGRSTENKKAKGRLKKILPNAVQPSKSTVLGDGLAKEVTAPKKSRVKNIVLSSKVSQITQVKSIVFDHLFEELKSCLGKNNLSVKEAGDILIKISAEDLLLAMKSAGLGDSLEKDRPSFGGTKNQDSTLAKRERKAISDTEEIVSQAAEALVSFRSKSPLSREKDSKVESNIMQTPLTSDLATKSSTAVSVEQSFGESWKVNPSVVTRGCLSSTQAVQALMQIQTSSVLSPQIFQTHVTSSPSQTLVQGQGYLAMSLPQQFSQPPPAGINTSFASMMPMVASHGALPSFSQIAAQLRPQSMPNGVQPPLLSVSAANPSVPTSVMLPTPNLVQPQIQPSVPIPNPVSTNKLQALTAMKNTGAPIEALGNKGAPNQKHILPQQPLKGMEEVVGNVGNVPPIVWSLKSPVVFLGSPQNLGGVPRNLMATSATQGVNVNPNKDQPGYPPVAPRPSSSDGTRINPGSVSSVPAPNVLTLGGRPILPRTQPRSAEDASNKRPQPIAPQSSLAFVTQQTSLGSPSIFPVPSTTPTVLGQGAVTQVSSALNPVRTSLVSVSLPGASLQINTTVGNLTNQGVPEGAAGDCSSPTVTAKQAVKKLVRERTKTAELKREASSSGASTKLKTILPSPPKPPETTTTTTTTTSTSSLATFIENPDSASKNSEFNLEQAATALLSIGVPDGSDMMKSSLADSLKDDPEEDVVFTSKGVFRVGDVDVDPHYNRIGREGYTCGKCNKIFTSLSYLARHIKRVCPDMSSRKWKCSLCNKAFRHPFGLQQHVYTHTGERPHKCPICPKAFYSSNDLRRHSRIHSGERPYICKHCDKSFATTISLKTHTYIHTGEKPHKCPQCPKTFATSSKLGRHIVTHSEQRPYSCDQCPKSFNRSGDLRRHNMAVHEGKEKSFDCEVCSMSFTKSADLRRHSTTHNPRPPKTMECADCGTQFSTPICLKMHRETYHKTPTTTTTTSTDTEKPSTCDMCGKTHSSAALLAKHKATHEPTSTAGYDASQFQHIAPKPLEQTSDPPSG